MLPGIIPSPPHRAFGEENSPFWYQLRRPQVNQLIPFFAAKKSITQTADQLTAARGLGKLQIINLRQTQTVKNQLFYGEIVAPDL